MRRTYGNVQKHESSNPVKNVRRFGNDPEHINHWSGRAFIELMAEHFDIVARAHPFPWTIVLAQV
jgi:hypothetical protein